MIRSLVGLVCAVAARDGAAPVLAHHSAAGIDRTKTSAVDRHRQGVPVEQPALLDRSRRAQRQGRHADTWSVEMTSPAFLLRAGLEVHARSRRATR